MDRAAGVIIAGRYRLVEKLGSGGMGTVWLADDLSLDSPCALKLIDPEKSQSDEVRKRFVREAKAAAQLRGPHVVDVFDRGESDGVLYIAMEYLEGEDLCTRLGRVGQLEPERTYRVIAHVARALSSAHALGIVHRDLKPENIFLVQSYDEEIAKVLDFGIAQHAAYRLQDRATREGSFLGTPYYVSPEQARGRPTDHRSDLWSLAVITYQCLAGVPPFDSESLGDLMGLILYEPIPKITEANPELPPGMEDWWARASQRDRELRFQSARELADQLGRVLEVKTVVSVPTLPPPRRHASIPDDHERFPVTSSFGARGTPSQSVPSVGTPVAAATLAQVVAQERTTFPPKDPLGVTNLAVTRTGPSMRPVKEGLAWGYARLKSSPRRILVVLAVGVGIIVGALATLFGASRTGEVTVLSPVPEVSAPQLVAEGSAHPAVPAVSAQDAGQAVYPVPQVLPIDPSVEELPRQPTQPAKRLPSSAGATKKAAPQDPWGI